MLAVEGTLHTYSQADDGILDAPAAIKIDTLVNGFYAPGTTNRYVQDCGLFSSPAVPGQNGASCTVTGTWWLDLDALETAHPGQFISKQLTVDLVGCLGNNGKSTTSDLGQSSLAVVMQKK